MRFDLVVAVIRGRHDLLQESSPPRRGSNNNQVATRSFKLGDEADIKTFIGSQRGLIRGAK